MLHPDVVVAVAGSRSEMGTGDLWVLIARSQIWEREGWLSEWLWRYRWATGVLSLEGHCEGCGVQLGDWGRSDARFCGAGCRQKAHRSRKGGAPTPWEAARRDAAADLKVLEGELRSYRSWYDEKRSAFIVPPDLLRIDHLPRLPGRCGRGCSQGASCRHTDGGPCLFGSTCSGAARDGEQ
jgi:hypothetical protein